MPAIFAIALPQLPDPMMATFCFGNEFDEDDDDDIVRDRMLLVVRVERWLDGLRGGDEERRIEWTCRFERVGLKLNRVLLIVILEIWLDKDRNPIFINQ